MCIFCNPSSGNIIIVNPSEHLPSTESTFEDPPGDIFDRVLPRENFCVINIPHPKPNFWCNGLDLKHKMIPNPKIQVYSEIPSVEKKYTQHLGDCFDTRGNPYYKKLELQDIIYNPFSQVVGEVAKWKSRTRVLIYAKYTTLPLRITPENIEHPEYWNFTDFVIFTKAWRNFNEIYTQVSSFIREFSHPFHLETCITEYQVTQTRDVCSRNMREKHHRGIPSSGSSQQSNSEW